MDKLEWLRRMAMLMLADDDAGDGGGSDDSQEDDDDGTDDDAGSNDDGEEEDDDDGGEGFDADRALSKIRKLNSENKNLRDREKKAREDAEKAGKDSGRVPELEAEVRRLRFGSKHGLPEEITAVLQGETEEEMLKHAEGLLKAFGASARRNPSLGNQRGGGSDPTRDLDDIDPDKIADGIPRL